MGWVVIICDSRDLTLQAIPSNGVAAVRQNLRPMFSATAAEGRRSCVLLGCQKSSPGAGDHNSGLARVSTFDRKTASANVKVEIEDRRSPGLVLRRATDRSLTFANLKHRKGVEYGRHLRTSGCAFQ